MALPSKKTLRDSGLIISSIILVLFFLIPYIIHGEINSIAIFLIIILFSLSIFSPNSLRIPYEIWIKIGNKLANINSKAVLFIFFYILVTPVSIFRRVGMLFLQNKKVKSFYINNSNQTAKSSFKDQF